MEEDMASRWLRGRTADLQTRRVVDEKMAGGKWSNGLAVSCLPWMIPCSPMTSQSQQTGRVQRGEEGSGAESRRAPALHSALTRPV